MDNQNVKCVIVVDENLPIGIISNTTAILGITLGKQHPEAVGKNIIDKTGKEHLGIIKCPIPILKGNPNLIKELRNRLYNPEFSDLTVVDFSQVAQSCNNYNEFIERLSDTPDSELQYYGVAICGSKRQVNKLTGFIPLLR